MSSFLKKIFYLYLFFYLLFGLFYYYNAISYLFFLSTIYAGILNLINSFIAVKLFKLSYKSGSSKFMIYNLGGLSLRLFALLIIFVLVIKFLNIDKYAFILVFFLFYFITLVIEVLFYLRIAKKIP